MVSERTESTPRAREGDPWTRRTAGHRDGGGCQPRSRARRWSVDGARAGATARTRARRDARLHEEADRTGQRPHHRLTMLGAHAGEVVAVVQTAMLGGMPYTGLRDAIFEIMPLAISHFFSIEEQLPDSARFAVYGVETVVDWLPLAGSASTSSAAFGRSSRGRTFRHRGFSRETSRCLVACADEHRAGQFA